MLAGNKAVAPQKTKIRNDDKMLSFSLESHHHHNNRIPNRPPAMPGLTGRDKHINNRSIFIAPEIQKEKIFAFLIMLSLLIPPLLYVFVIPIDDNSSFNNDESNENPDMIVAPDNTITFTAKESVKTRKNPKITGTRGYSGTSPPIGDWTITGDAVVWNETVTLNGNLTVTETGNLTLINVTLKVNCRYNGEFHIDVLGGGGLYIYDFDWDRLTEEDASNITAVNSSYKYLFWVRKGSYFEMRNSKLSWCGYEWGTNGNHSGLWINTDYAVIEGNIIRNAYNGIVIYEGNYTLIENNTISDNIIEQVSYSGFSVNSMGIFSSINYGCFIYNNTIFNITGRKWGGIGAGIYISYTENNIVNSNRIYSIKGAVGINRLGRGQDGQKGGTGSGVYNHNSLNTIIKNNYFNNMTGGIGGEGYKSGGYGGIGSGIYLYNSEHCAIENNKIMNNTGGNGGNGGEYGGPGGAGIGILFDSSHHNMIHNNILLNNRGGDGREGGRHGGQGGPGGGFSLKSSFNNNLSNNLVMESYRGLPGYRGINGWGCGIGSISYSYNNIIINTTMIKSGDGDLYLNSDSHLTVLNSTFKRNKVIFIESKSSLIVQWFLQVKVTIYDVPINNASVRIKENPNGTFDKTFMTNAYGLIKSIPVTEYKQSKTQITYLTSHNLEASIDSYGYNITVWMDENKFIVIALENSTYPVYCINLHEGWNLISLPFIQINTSLKTVLQPIEGKYNAVQCFYPSEKVDPWKHYCASKPSSLNDLISLDHKRGIWIHINVSGRTSFFVSGIKPSTPQTIELYPGWNLVGYPSIANRQIDEALNNLKFRTDVDAIYYFDSVTKRFISLESNDIMKKGVGYWVHSKTKVTWVLNNSVPTVYNINKDVHYYTIQKAIDNANCYDTIIISPGIFNENLIINKSINIVGKLPKSTILNGDGGTCANISANYLYLNNFVFYNCSNCLYFENSSNINLKNILLQNALRYGIYINNSTNFKISNVTMSGNSYGISTNNCSEIIICNSKVLDQIVSSLLLQKSNVTLLNVTLNTDKIEFLDTKSNLIIQWYLHVQTIDQIDYPISGTNVRITDNYNGTYNRTFITNAEGYVECIIATERIQNSTGNLSFEPHNIIVSHPEFTFIKDFSEITINRSIIARFMSINTVIKTPIHNLVRNRYYLTIQEAIDDTNPHDTIQLSPGIYFENVNINKPLSLVGQDQDLTVFYGYGGIYVNVTSDDVMLSDLNIQNCTYGIYCNNSSPTIDHCTIENNTFGIAGFNSSSPVITNTTLQNEILDFLISSSHFTILNTRFNSTKVKFLDGLSNLTVKWYLHVHVKDANDIPIEGANVRIMDNENGTFDENFTTGSDGYARWIALTERIQNLSGNVSFNPYSINVSYYDPVEEWFTFPDNPRNITINGTLFEIRKEIFTSLEAIPEFSHILMPIVAIIASFVVFRKLTRKP